MTDPDPGILASIPNQCVLTATFQLPAADTSTAQYADIELDVPGIGRVRFTARRMVDKARGRTVCYWSMRRAEVVASETG